jgi:hypothetical protein
MNLIEATELMHSFSIQKTIWLIIQLKQWQYATQRHILLNYLFEVSQKNWINVNYLAKLHGRRVQWLQARPPLRLTAAPSFTSPPLLLAATGTVPLRSGVPTVVTTLASAGLAITGWNWIKTHHDVSANAHNKPYCVCSSSFLLFCTWECSWN